MAVLSIKMANTHEMVNINTGDEIDKPPSQCRVELYEVIFIYISIVFHMIDIAFDINVAIRYLIHDQFAYFGFTIAIIIIPALINTVLSVRMYMLDEDNESRGKTCASNGFLFFIIIFQLAPVLRYIETARYAVKCRKAEHEKDNARQRKYYELMLKEDSDLSLLRIIECFLEAAPQQILQITILLVSYDRGISTFSLIHNVGSILSSFISMAWSMASYHRVIRFAQKTKLNICWKGTLIQFMWHILVTVSRILSISVLASVYPTYTCIGLFVHWVVMSVWLSVSEKLNFCDNNRYLDSLLCAVFGLVYIFTFFSLSDGSTKYKYSFYYILCFVENITAAFFWYFTANDDVRETLYYKPLIYFTILPFLLGIAFMILYYKCFHPMVRFSTCRRIGDFAENRGRVNN